jgi:NADH:ubiquinone oxidoreductase subunit F (NADH-binding)
MPTLELSPASAVAQRRLLVDGLLARESYADYVQRGGYSAAAWGLSRAELLERVDESGLRGRGGAAFPTGRKWKSVASQPGPRAVLVNGAESEPASRKDRLLLSLRPHLVIEGALLAIRAVAARECVFYVHENALAERAALEAALAELKAVGRLLPSWRVVTAPAGYVAGEESAAVQRANGKSARPTFKPPYVYERGIGGRPTLGNNVETLANIPFIAREGGAAFRSIGGPSSPGTFLITLSGAIRRPGVYEVPGGVSLGRVLDELGGGTPNGVPIQAVIPGGYFAGWLGRAALREGATLDPESLGHHGTLLGSGAIVGIPESVCGLAQAVALLRFFARESVQQCGPCKFGTRAMADALARPEWGAPAARDLERLRRYAAEMLPRRGACAHLDGATIAARTALNVFAPEIDHHARFGTCGRSTEIVLPGMGENP